MRHCEAFKGNRCLQRLISLYNLGAGALPSVYILFSWQRRKHWPHESLVILWVCALRSSAQMMTLLCWLWAWQTTCHVAKVKAIFPIIKAIQGYHDGEQISTISPFAMEKFYFAGKQGRSFDWNSCGKLSTTHLIFETFFSFQIRRPIGTTFEILLPVLLICVLILPKWVRLVWIYY